MEVKKNSSARILISFNNTGLAFFTHKHLLFHLNRSYRIVCQVALYDCFVKSQEKLDVTTGVAMDCFWRDIAPTSFLINYKTFSGISMLLAIIAEVEGKRFII